MKATLMFLSLMVLLTSYTTTSTSDGTTLSLVKEAITAAKKIPNDPSHDSEVQGAIELTSNDFDQSISDGNIWLIEFYAPWCSHCVRFASTYDSLADKLHGMNGLTERNVMVAKVDGSSDKILASRFNVRGFPALFLVDGWTVWEFEGNRSKENLLKFAIDSEKDVEPIPFLSSPFGPLGQVRSLLVHICTDIWDQYNDMVDSGYSPAFAAIVMGSIGVIVAIIFILVVGYYSLPKVKDD